MLLMCYCNTGGRSTAAGGAHDGARVHPQKSVEALTGPGHLHSGRSGAGCGHTVHAGLRECVVELENRRIVIPVLSDMFRRE